MSCNNITEQQSLTVGVGMSPIWAFNCTDPDTDTPVDITNASFEFYVKGTEYDEDGDAVYTLTSADYEIVITDAAAGQAQIINDAAKTDLLTAGRVYYWSLRVTFPSTEERVIGRGDLTAQYP